MLILSKFRGTIFGASGFLFTNRIATVHHFPREKFPVSVMLTAVE